MSTSNVYTCRREDTSSHCSGSHVANNVLRRKSATSQANTAGEAQADAMADHIMRMPQPSLIQRKCAHCEEEENLVQRSPQAGFIQRQETSAASPASDATSSAIDSTRGGGHPLPEGTRDFMESRFGQSFEDVRIHTGSYATRLSDNLQAEAFTVGRDIYFNKGRFAPESSEGKHLLAHELTHVVQQSASGTGVQRKLKLTGTDEDTRKKFLAKMNDGSSVAMEMEADGNIKATDPKATGKDEYAKKMLEAINDAQTVNLHLIPKSDTTFIDTFATGDVDTDDTLNLSSPIFRSWLLHFVVERFATKDYEKNKATASAADFSKAHQAGHESQEKFLKETYPTKTIKYIGEGFDNTTKKVDGSNNGSIDYYFDFTDVKYIFTQPIVAGVTKENIIKSELKIVK